MKKHANLCHVSPDDRDNCNYLNKVMPGVLSDEQTPEIRWSVQIPLNWLQKRLFALDKLLLAKNKSL